MNVRTYVFHLQAKHALFVEVTEINQQQIDAVVDLSDEDTIPTATAAATAGSEGTIVKCSFSAVSFSPNYKSQQLSAQIVRFQAFQSKLFINYMHYFFYPSY